MRSLCCRVYVNRTVNMDKIKFIGFDMDYTLVGMLLKFLSRYFIVIIACL